MRRYFDHNATSPLQPRVREAIVHSMERVHGNPSSIHEEGRVARDLVEGARRRVAQAISARPEEIVFTSGGTEADAIGIVGLARLARDKGTATVFSTAIEHPACAASVSRLGAGFYGSGIESVRVPVDQDGVIVESGLSAVRGGPGLLVTHLVNHELGTVQAIRRLADLAHELGMWLHCDAVQALGKLAVDVTELGVDSLAISAHKIGGPMGAGALWVRSGLDIDPLVGGGHQERGRRPGTESLYGIVGFGAACELVAERLSRAENVAAMAARLERDLLGIPGARVHGVGGPRVGNTVNVGFEGARGDVLVQALDLAGVAASTGSACTSGTVEPSGVLLGLGLEAERASEAVRFSLGPSNTEEDVDHVAQVMPGMVARAREFSQ